MTEAIELIPSFPAKLEKEGACLTVRRVPFSSKILGWLVLAVAIFCAMLLVAAAYPQFYNFSHVVAIAAGALAYLVFSVIYGALVSRHHMKVQAEARAKCHPIRFLFNAEGFVIDAANTRSEYNWNAIDEIAELSGGTGIRTGVFVYAVADDDLPGGMSSKAFRDQLSAWQS